MWTVGAERASSSPRELTSAPRRTLPRWTTTPSPNEERDERRRGIAAGAILVAAIALLGILRFAHAEGPSAAEQALRRTLPEVYFRNTPLDEALSTLARLGGTPIVVDQAALHAAGIDPTEPVDLRLTGVAFHQAVGHILDYVSSDNAERLVHTLHRGQIIVTPEGSLDRYVYARVYGVRDIRDPPEWVSAFPVGPGGLCGGRPLARRKKRPGRSTGSLRRDVIRGGAVSATS